MNLGEKIQMLRKSAGLSQEELAEKIYVTRQSVSLWEQNKSQPSIDNVAMLCEVFKISADELLGIGGKSIPFKNQNSEFKNIPSEAERPFATAHTACNLFGLKKSYSILHTKKWIKYPIIGIFLFLFGLREFLRDHEKILLDNIIIWACMIIGAAFMLLFFYLKINDIKKAKEFINANGNIEDDFLFFNDRIVIRTIADNAAAEEKELLYSQLKTVKVSGRFIIFETDKRVFYILVNAFYGNVNYVLNICKNQAMFFSSPYDKKINPPKNMNPKKIKRVKRNSTAMTVILVVIFSLLAVFVFVKNNNDQLRKMNLVFIPVIFMFLTVLYMIYGQYWKKKGIWIREIMPIGLVMLFLFNMIATMYFSREFEYKTRGELKITVSTHEYELLLNTTLPKEGFLYNLESPENTSDISYGEAKKIVLSDKNGIKEFEENIDEIEIWKTSLEEFDTDLTADEELWKDCDYFSIYNSYETNENGGEKKMFFGYDCEKNALYICEFAEK